MPVDRPTFSESWYRVADLRPRLRSTLQTHRQRFRGELWFVLQDPASNQFFRLNKAAWHMVALLDGRRTVSEAWKIANEQLGDSAPTQGETIQLLGQLYTSNLIQAELPPDAEGLFQRYSKRRQREVQGYLTNLLFVRIPLFDPDRLLDRWVWLFGRIFSWYGLGIWIALMLAGGYAIMSRIGELKSGASNVLDPSNLPLLYIGFVLVKVFHEFGHAFACKQMGRRQGGGEVHVMGIMLLVLTPMPYVDASSAWAFRSKWQRAAVGGAGIYIDLAVAAAAAIVWSVTGQGAVHGIAFNIMFIASVATLLFNANPLLRYDGYYMLSDVLEMPNLSQRGRDYIYYLVRRYVWGVRQVRNPANDSGERIWLAVYGAASTVYRVFICAFILLFVADKFFVLGFVLAIAAVIGWVVVPLAKFVRYLITSPELSRVRLRALGSTAAVAALLATLLGIMRMPEYVRIEGVVEPAAVAVIHSETDGFVSQVLASGQPALTDGAPLLVMVNQRLEAQRRQLVAQRAELEARYRQAKVKQPVEAQVALEQLMATDKQIARLVEQFESMVIRAPINGTWVSPESDRLQHIYLKPGQRIGMVASLDMMTIRATAGQSTAARLIGEAGSRVDIRIKGRPDLQLSGSLMRIMPAGQQQLPSAALGYAAGGAMATAADDPQGLKTSERFFEVLVVPDKPEPGDDCSVRLLSGQRVVVRLHLPSRPYGSQLWHRLLQLVQKRFHI